MGVWMCSGGCGTPLRPVTDKERRDEQANADCPVCGNRGFTRLRCDVIITWYEEVRDGEVWVVWEHSGTHVHPRPAPKRLSHSEREDVRAQVQRRPKASALELRTGDTASGSVPLADISPLLAKGSTARYYVEDAQTSLGISPAPSLKGGEASFLKSIAHLNTELGEEFVVDAGVYPQAYIALRTPWMKMILEKSVDEWVSGSPLVYGRRGFVTDGNHSFFKEGAVLLTTCVFSRVLWQWVPVLYTIILGEDEEHHHPHFRNLFDPVIQKAIQEAIEFAKEFLLNVSVSPEFSVPTSSTQAHFTGYRLLSGPA